MQNLEDKYFSLLKKEFNSLESCRTELINLSAILNLPKGTEHFISDIHGEYDAFLHILNNCSGVIKEKIDSLFVEKTEEERREFATLIYYPNEKLNYLKECEIINEDWYFDTLVDLVRITSLISSKYTRSKVKKALSKNYSYIIDELLHTKDNSESNIKQYFSNILKIIIKTNGADGFICEFARLIKVLAVDHLHIAGDIFDRGPNPDKICDLLYNHHSLDIEWGNHDLLWLGASCGIPTCVFTVLYNNLKYGNFRLLENGYGISLRKLLNYADALYLNEKNIVDPLVKTIAIMLFKLEGEVIKRNKEFDLNSRLVLNNLNLDRGIYTSNGKEYELKDKVINNINPKNPYLISDIERDIINDLCNDFKNSIRLKKHVNFLLDNGMVYKVMNGNLIYHGCVPFTLDKEFKEVYVVNKYYKGKELFDKIDQIIRKVCLKEHTKKEEDFMYYLWAGFDSPFTGRVYKTFELLFTSDKELQHEPRNTYYDLRNDEDVLDKILTEFDLKTKHGHIINGHLPVKAKNGENPLKCKGKLIIIDGGFCKAYHQKTGIAGYTLIYNSHGMRIKAHQEFSSIEEVVKNDTDIISNSKIFDTAKRRILVKDTDNGKKISDQVEDLTRLLKYYQKEKI